MVNLLDFFQTIKDSYEKIKSAIDITKEKFATIVERLPSTNLSESYFYDEIKKTWFHKDSLESRTILPYIFDSNQNLLVETPNYKIFEGTIFGG